MGTPYVANLALSLYILIDREEYFYMISVNDFKTGLTIEVENDIWQVMEFQHVKPGKGAAFVRSKLRNLRNGNIQEKTFRAGEKVGKAHIENKTMQYLYASGNSHAFMDTNTYEQIELASEQIENELKIMKENMEVSIIDYEGEVQIGRAHV